MSRTTPPDHRDEPSAPATLGDVLYAGRQERHALESEWVAVVRSIAAGDHRALFDLYRRTHRLIFTLSVRVTGDREIAEELTIEVLHEVWRRAARYDPADGTVLGWIMNLARSKALDRVPFDMRNERVAPDPNAASQLLELLAALTPEERQAIEATFFRELTHAEAAERLNEPPGTVKTRVRSALLKLREVLAVPEGKS